MDSNRNSSVIEIDDDVIDLDGSEKTPEDEVYEWDAKVRKSLSMYSVAENDHVLGNFMKQYMQSFEEMIAHFDGHESLRLKAFAHLTFFYSYFDELQCCNSDNYLTCMEDLLTLYCSLEFEVVRRLYTSKTAATNEKTVVRVSAKRIIYAVTVYLFERRENILHVLMKMSVSNDVPACGKILNRIFKHFLCAYTESTRGNDEAFCRIYILYQKWKNFNEEAQWAAMDNILYKTSHRRPEELETNETLRKILTPSSESVGTIMMNVFRSCEDISSAYFKHISLKKTVEIDDLDLNINLGEDEPAAITPPDDEDDEAVKFSIAFDLQMSALVASSSSELSPTEMHLKQEPEDDDDVVFVGESRLQQPEEAESITLTDAESPEARFPEPQFSEKPAVHTPPPPPPNLNGISKMCISSVVTVSETEQPPVLEPAEAPVSPSQEAVVDTGSVAEEIDIFEVMQTMQMRVDEEMPCLQAEDISAIAESGGEEEEQQQSHLYNDFGLTTPPFDVAAGDDQHPKCVYTGIVAVETEKETNSAGTDIDYGLTPPTDVPVEDSRPDEDYPLGDAYPKRTEEDEIVSEPEKEYESENEPHEQVPEMEQEEEIVEDHDDIIREEAIERELEEEEAQIDTGQKSVPDTAPNIPQIVNNNLAAKEVVNGGVAVVGNAALNHRMNGGAKEPVAGGAQKTLFASKTITAPLDTFTMFENKWRDSRESAEFEDVYSGPVAAKLSVPGAVPSVGGEGGRADSPGDITSPPYEELGKDLGAWFGDNVAGGGREVRPQGILKTNGGTSRSGGISEGGGKPVRKKNVNLDGTVSVRVISSESEVEASAEREDEQSSRVVVSAVRRQGSGGGVAKVPRGTNSDTQLHQKANVTLERLSAIELALRKAGDATSKTVRVDYDKSSQEIGAKDEVRCASPPRITLRVQSTKSGSYIVTTLSRSNEYEYRPEKRKYEVPSASVRKVQEPVAKKKRVFRSPKKKAIGLRRVQEKRSGGDAAAEEEENDEEVQQQPKRRQQRNCSKKLVNNSTSGRTNNRLSSNNSDSEFDKVITSEGYTHQPFRVDFAS